MICKYCGKEFERKKNQQKYCDDCSKLSIEVRIGKSFDNRKPQTCKECGKEFHHNRKRKFCSNECMKQYHLKQARERRTTEEHRQTLKPKDAPKPKLKCICEHCGIEFESFYKSKYCSGSCKAKAFRERNPVKSYTYTCKNCGKKYHPKQKSRDTYCSLECQREYRTNNRKPKPIPILEAIKQCDQCGTEFKTKSKTKTICDVCAYEKSKQRTIERVKAKAREAYKAEVKVTICNHCGNEFLPVFKPAWRNQKFCCIDCAKKASYISESKREGRRRYRARKHNAYVEKVITKQIYERDNGKCKLCGLKIDLNLKAPHPMSLSIDHIIPLYLGGTHEPKNVQCAHLKCNTMKGVKPMGEQLRII